MKTYLRRRTNQSWCKTILRSQLALKSVGAMALWCITTCCFATVLYDNLGNAFTGTDTIEGPAARGISFTTDSATYNALTATLPLSADRVAGAGHPRSLSDVNSTIGNPLGVFASPSSFSIFSGLNLNQTLETFTLSGVTLSPNTPYWLVLQDFASPSFGVHWSWTNDHTGTGIGFTFLEAKTTDGGSTWTYPASVLPMFAAPNQAQIVATFVPEPPSAALATLAVAMLIGVARAAGWPSVHLRFSSFNA